MASVRWYNLGKYRTTGIVTDKVGSIDLAMKGWYNQIKPTNEV